MNEFQTIIWSKQDGIRETINHMINNVPRIGDKLKYRVDSVPSYKRVINVVWGMDDLNTLEIEIE